MIYRFGDFELHEGGFCLIRNGHRIALEPKALSVLLVLVSRAGRLVDKRSLLELVWNGTFVEENTLTRTIGVIRRELGDSTKESRFIETIPTRGYRFIAPVDTLPEQASASTLACAAPVSSPTPRGRPNRHILILTAIAAVIIVSGFAVWRLYAKAASEEPTVVTPVPLTTYRGSENAPSFSPDGDQVAFEWNSEKQNKFDIYIKVVGSDSTPLRLTNAPDPSRWPSWSPDGRTIAFERVVSPGTVYLILIPALGGPERKLAEFHTWTDAQGSSPTWSVNSKWLVLPAVVESRPHLVRISVDTGEFNPITDPPTSLADAFPTISPDGKTLLFARHGAFNAGSLYSVKVDADAKPLGSPTQLSVGPRFWESRWTADSSEIIAHTYGDRFHGAVRIRPDGSPPFQHIPWLNSEGSFDIARRGHRLAFSAVHGDTNIWRIDLTAKPLHPEPFIASTVRDVFPQYSPDGRKLAFHSSRSGTGLDIWISDSEGNQARQLTFMRPGLTGSPHWSPDGQTLAFDSSSTGHFQIYTMSSDGGKISQRTHGNFDSFGATWSRDGRWLYFTTNQSGRNEIWKIPVTGGTSIQVTHNGGAMAIESQDGATLYFSKEAGTGSIWKMPISGGPEQQLTDSLFRTNFAVTKKGIYFMTAPSIDGTSEIRFYSFVTGATTIIVPIGLPEYGLAVSPDERYLVYDQLDDPASDLMLVDNFH
ncbi:winged helix-turn-helix domain-containing protein [Edaphobacter albus]|uniref:winged helix-turn-helix domain-containing protein n=1 Tax=Edaphobacter sp. 4G125 TaxID=2763071 RepID=UPI0016451089|nr:winged helix-turn-helix domain-containing protein [Edaphobacter sp. 4G125]QNI37275.1 PD40 domain-containing protein [Edaphobacter sp. 4G125]